MLCSFVGNVRSREYGLLSKAGISYFSSRMKYLGLPLLPLHFGGCCPMYYNNLLHKVDKLTLHDHAMGFSLILQYIMDN